MKAIFVPKGWWRTS
ncbi:trp operon leader peptide [Escherichia coli]|nr:trp operon leader peptide [Escherichia coli]